MIRKDINLEHLTRLYKSGVSEKALAEKFSVARTVIRRRLIELGIKPRNRSESMFVRMAQTTKEERCRLTEAAHNAVRGVRHSFERRCKIAQTREIKPSRMHISPKELRLIKMLHKVGIECTGQKAIGKYNVDIALNKFPITIDIFGGGWHTYGSHAARHRERFDYILNAGWYPIVVWVSANYPIEVDLIEYIISLTKHIRRAKPKWSEEQVVRGDGQRCSIGKDKFNGIPTIGSTQPRNKTTGRYDFRSR
jgi:very-short-patch-repair endonuclease